MQAHPRYPRTDWAPPERRRSWQIVIAVLVQTALILGLILAILAVGGVAGAALGLDMGPAR